MRLPKNYIYNGIKYKIKESPLKNKQLVAISENGKEIHFGDPRMKEYPGTKRETSFCARSFGITNKMGEPTRNNPNSPNFWNRRISWQCFGKNSRNI